MVARLEAVSTDEIVIQKLHRIFDLQQAAFRKNPYPSAEERIELMKRIPKMLRK